MRKQLGYAMIAVAAAGVIGAGIQGVHAPLGYTLAGVMLTWGAFLVL